MKDNAPTKNQRRGGRVAQHRPIVSGGELPMVGLSKFDVSVKEAGERRNEQMRAVCEYLIEAIALEDRYARVLCKQTGAPSVTRLAIALKRAGSLRAELRAVQQGGSQ